MELREIRATPTGAWASRAQDLADHVWFALQLQALWLLGVLRGGVVLGWAPAMVAAASLARDRERGEGTGVWNRYWAAWRHDFRPANLGGAPLALLAPIVGLNLAWAAPQGPVLATASWAGGALLTGALCWFGPLLAHYDLPPSRHALTALRLVVRRPVPTLVMLLVTAGLAWASSWSGAVLAFVAVGAWLTACTHVALGTFAENEERLLDGPPAESLASILPSRPLETH